MQNKSQGTPLTPAVMVHFYRGMIDLAVTWRGRMDGTTNWAVVSSGSIASFLLSDPAHSHIMALLGMFLVFAFLSIEARRFRFYDLWSGWIRIMETEYYEPLLRQNVVSARERWHTLLDRDLDAPHFKISWATAMGRRLRHNYFAIFMFLLLAWATKLLLHPSPAQLGVAFRTMYERANLGPISGQLVVGGVAIFYSYLIALMLITLRSPGRSGETLPRHLMLRQLVSPTARRIGLRHEGGQYGAPIKRSGPIADED